MSAEVAGRRYRFGSLHRTGLFGAIAPTLLVVVVVGVVASWLAFMADTLPLVALVPVAASAAVGLGRVGGQPLHELLPRLAMWALRRARRRHRWIRPVPLLTGNGRPSPVPPVLDGLELFDVDATDRVQRDRSVGVIRDRHAGTVTAVLRVHGDGSFALADPSTQDNRVDLWGLALAGFCREATPVCRVAWHDWTSPTGVADHLRSLRQRMPAERGPAQESYIDLVESVAPTSVRHEVLVSVTVDLRRAARRRRTVGLDTGVTVLLDEIQRFAGRLDHAGLVCDAPLAAADVVTAMRVRSDPTSLDRLATLRRSLAAAASHAPPEFGPMAMSEQWGSVRVDGAVHRSWWFGRWPRREVPAAWLDQLLFSVPCTRSVTVVFEPIAPSRSDRDIDRESVARSTNADDKARRGFRIKAADRKAAREVELRESELNDGFGELTYVGLLTATVANAADLDRVGAEVEQAAAQAGIELLPLFARQAAGWVSSLPLGRTVARRVK